MVLGGNGAYSYFACRWETASVSDSALQEPGPKGSLMATGNQFVAMRQTRLAFAVTAASLPFAPEVGHAQTSVNALPTGGSVTAGSATISSSANKLQIDQSTQKAILQWDTFSIGSSAWVNFSQPSSSAIALNRVLGSNPSEIFGRLTANGQVFLTNPNGVLFAPSAAVDVGGLFAPSHSIADKDFLAGRYNFYTAGGAGSVINQGQIITANGYAALAGPQVRNDGVIIARAGGVALAAGDRISLDMVGDGLIKVSVEQAALNASAINSGRIEADGGNVILTARSANALLDTVVNNSGVIRANSLVERNGEIVLDGGSAGVVSNTGTLTASGAAADTTGGTVKVLGQYVGLFDGSRIDASGDAGGGTVLVRGNFHGGGPEQNASMTYVGRDVSINADDVTSGTGGKVAVWSDVSTRFFGSISGNGGVQGGDGGFAEVSGKQNLGFDGLVSLGATRGRTGTLLLDPADLYLGIDPVNGAVDPGPSPFPVSVFNATGPGDNFVTAVSIAAAGNVAFDFQAGHDVIFNASIVAANAGGNTFAVTAGSAITMNGNSLTTGGGGISFNAGSMTLGGLNSGTGAVTATASGG